MPGFLYYAVGHSRAVSRDDLVAWELGYVGDEVASPAEAVQGPVGHGVIFANSKTLGSFDVAYRKTDQTWSLLRPATDGTPELHVGHWNQGRPGPIDLIRDNALAGHLVELADGNQWQVPVARSWVGLDPPIYTAALPQKLTFDPTTGKWSESGIVPEYQRLWEIAEEFQNFKRTQVARLWDRLSEEDRKEIQKPEAEIEVTWGVDDPVNLAVEVLGHNYAVGPVELSMLSAISNNGEVRQVLDALNDQPTLDNWLQKKTAPGG